MLIRAGRALISVLALMLCMTAASAQQYQDARPPAFSQQQLDQMLAPIALYPDSLLSQILMAATYPRDVVDAADWSRRNGTLNGDRAVRAAERYDWDPSVKSLVAFPQILDMMNQKITWTEDLGDAFLDQQGQVMDTVQYLRRQAYAAGNLRSSEQMRVEVRDSSYVVEFSNPEVVYLPYYNPVVVYGRWWWPTYQPVYWAPWPGYRARPGYAYAWGAPIPVSRGFFYSAPDWRNRRVQIVNVNNYYYRPAFEHRADAPRSVVAGAPPVWHHDVERRREMPQRHGAWQPPARDAAMNRAPVAGNPSPAVAPQPVVAAPVPVAPQRGEPARGADSHANDPRRFDGRPDQRRDGRFEQGNRQNERGNAQPAAAAPVATPASPPVAAVQAPAPRHSEPRAMPVPTPAPAATPAAANRPNAEQRPNVARGQDNNNHQNNAQDRGNRQDNSDNAVAAANGNSRGNGNGNGNSNGNGGGNPHRRD
ncbi:MAG: hypothetical protein JWN94_3671 [Betaproteobacteria bacterium]|nr:hypothetical protein [Betaproteobacteria bacterium]